jgi:hypothetical protein
LISTVFRTFGEHPLVESHYLSNRSRRQPSVLTFLAQEADSQVFCYSNADIRKGEEAEESFNFIKFWERRHGSLPAASRLRLQTPPPTCRATDFEARNDTIQTTNSAPNPSPSVFR